MFFESLNPNEVAFFRCLEMVNLNSYWGAGIQTVVNDPDLMRFRRLVCELKSAADDSHEIMKSILGEECFNALLTL